MGTVQLKLRQIKPYLEAKTKAVVREASIDLQARLISYSPVWVKNGGTFKANWQPPVYADGGFTGRVVNVTQKYGLAITFGGKHIPPSWNDDFKSRFGLPERWPVVLAGKETQEMLPSIWNRIRG